MRNWWLYVLKLEQGKYYVGITSQTPEIRMQEHINHVRAAYWTMKYRPIALLHSEDLGKITKEAAERIESIKTQDLMAELGINNVRGGHLREANDDYVLIHDRYMKGEDFEVLRFIFAQTAIILLLLGILQVNGVRLF